MADLKDASVRLDIEGIHQRTRAELGGTRFSVELDPQQIDAAIGDALRECRKYLLGVKTLSISDVGGHRKLTVADGIPANAFAVVRFDVLAIHSDSPAVYDLSPFDLARRASVGRHARLRPGEMFELESHVRATQHVFGTTPDYKFDRGPPPTLTCFIATAPMNLSVDFGVPITTFDTIPFEQEAVFLHLVEGRCRIILGTNRGKYGNVIQGPTGDIQTDAAEQLQSGKEIWAAAVAELVNLASPLPPIIG